MADTVPCAQVVFSAECSHLFDWHTVGIFYSFEMSGFNQVANLTRLLACNERVRRSPAEHVCRALPRNGVLPCGVALPAPRRASLPVGSHLPQFLMRGRAEAETRCNGSRSTPSRVHRSQERLAYPASNLGIGPTFVHRNMRDDPLVDEKGYPSYNKPYSVMAWLEGRPPLPKGEDEYVLMTDADMVFTGPIDPQAYGAARGVVISAEYSYLIGTETGFAKRFIDPALVPRLAQVGPTRTVPGSASPPRLNNPCCSISVTRGPAAGRRWAASTSSTWRTCGPSRRFGLSTPRGCAPSRPPSRSSSSSSR